MIYGNDSTELEIILSNLDCRGNESSLLDCRVNVHNRVTQDCDHTELAGVRCGGRLKGGGGCQSNSFYTLVTGVCQDGDVRLIVGEDYEYYYGGDTQDSSYYIDNQLSRGRLELCLNGQWGVACQDYWQDEQASVVCNQLGFASVGKHRYIWF